MTNLTITRGDSATFRLAVVDSDGDSVDLSLFDIVFTAKRGYAGAAVIEKSLGEGITLGQPGECFVALEPADTLPVAARTRETLRWDIEVSDGETTRTPLSGILRVLPDAGRSTEAS